MLQYCDDFNEKSPLFPRGSEGGFYMLPNGLSLSQCSILSSIRTISLTTAALSTNNVFDIIIPDIMEGITSVFACFDANSVQSKIFLEVTGFMADYPVSAYVLRKWKGVIFINNQRTNSQLNGHEIDINDTKQKQLVQQISYYEGLHNSNVSVFSKSLLRRTANFSASNYHQYFIKHPYVIETILDKIDINNSPTLLTNTNDGFVRRSFLPIVIYLAPGSYIRLGYIGSCQGAIMCNDNLFLSLSYSSKTVDLLNLTKIVRKVACIRSCRLDGDFHFNLNGKVKEHVNDVTPGGFFYVIGQLDVYPPSIS